MTPFMSINDVEVKDYGERIETQVPGNIWKVLVKPGDTVKAGDTLFIMEVMKTEVPHDAGVDGTVSECASPKARKAWKPASWLL